MNVKLLGHTRLNGEFFEDLYLSGVMANEFTDGQAIAMTAIRTCYSHNESSKILDLEADKYFGSEATDGKGGNDADRLIRHIVNSGHTSTLEHINFTFSLEGVSRSLLAQLTRHRHFSYSVQSQRYNKLETTSKSGGFDYVIPETIKVKEIDGAPYESLMEDIQKAYDALRKAGVPAEDARMVLPNAATCNLVLTGNLRSFLDFYSKRSAKGAQWEIRELAERIKSEIVEVEPWTEGFFKTE